MISRIRNRAWDFWPTSTHQRLFMAIEKLMYYVNINAFFKWYMYKYGSTYIKVFQRLIHFYKKQLISTLMISVLMMRNVIINYKLLYFHYLLIWIQVLVFFLHPIMHCKSNAGHLLSQNHQRTEEEKAKDKCKLKAQLPQGKTFNNVSCLSICLNQISVIKIWLIRMANIWEMLTKYQRRRQFILHLYWYNII